MVNAHLLPEMFEDDLRQSELSYEDSGKGGSVDDLSRLALAQHAAGFPGGHHAPARLSLRGPSAGAIAATLRGGPEGTLC